MLKTINKKTCFRILYIAAASLITGITVNQIHSQGIPLRLILLHCSVNSNQNGWQPLSTDSSFVCYSMNSAVFYDIRPAEDYKLDHVKGAKSLPFYKFIRHPKEFDLYDKTTPLILYDLLQQSHKAPIMIRLLNNMGFNNIFFLRNGFSEWLEYGFPTEKGDHIGS